MGLKKRFDKWYNDFKIDPVFNTIMYILTALLLVLVILLNVIAIKEAIQCLK